ncbi:MAG TPA: hypothetical protein VM661_18750 [Candidatus Sulfotelmatobacter sp.]|jgi:hypothetical protein|nr:hypothetical protein [Candidatus Sulfotelmatobacter sp.]
MTAADMELRLAEPARPGQKIWAAALAVSLLVHLVMVYLLTHDLPWSRKDDEETAVTVSLVQAPEVKPPETPLPKPEVKAEPKPEPKPEVKAQPKPEPKPEVKALPKPEVEPVPPPPAKPAAPKAEAFKAAPPKPNLSQDKVAEKSSRTAPTDKELADKARSSLDPATRSLSDLILSRVSQLWSPPPQLRGRGAQIHFVIDLLPNGMFGPPFAADMPWNPEAALSGLNQIPPNDPRYTALMNFYRTLREIQPIPVPPGMVGPGPRSVPVWFSLDDMP